MNVSTFPPQRLRNPSGLEKMGKAKEIRNSEMKLKNKAPAYHMESGMRTINQSEL